MEKHYSERSLLDFQKEFATEEACVQHMIKMRWPNGFTCVSSETITYQKLTDPE